MNKLVSKLKKIHQFLFNGILYSPKTLYIFLISPLIKTNFPKINWLSQTELINKIKKGESVIRLGDGEIMLITGRDIHFQKSSKSLSHELKEIVTSYNKNSKYILCLPTEALTFNEAELKKIDRLRIWRLFRAYFRDKIKNNLSYGDAHIFYRKEFLNNLTPLFKNRYVISVSHQGTIDQNFKKIMDKNSGQTNYVISPDKNAYQNKGKIINDIDLAINKKTHYSPLLLLATGPTSKALAHKYANEGIQTIDIGHGMEILTKELDYSNRI